MKKTILLSLFLSACMPMRKEILIEGASKEENMREHITIYMNGVTIIQGELHERKQYDIFWGEFKGDPVSAECELIYTQKYDIEPSHLCQIFLYKEKYLGDIQF